MSLVVQWYCLDERDAKVLLDMGGISLHIFLGLRVRMTCQSPSELKVYTDLPESELVVSDFSADSSQ